MFDSRQFDDLSKKLFSILPAGLQGIENDIQAKFREILQATFARLDLVTRDEFDVQVKVLARTREKLDSLQALVDNLLADKKDDSI